MYLFDSHCHIDKIFDYFLFKNINDFLLFLKKRKIKYILCVSVSIKNFFSIFSILSYIKQNIIKLSCGIHPLYINNIKKDDLYYLEKIILFKNVLAIGECGLDYKNINDSYIKNIQIKIFIKHLILSDKYRKPCIIHSRMSWLDTFNIIRKFNILNFGAVLHCFSYSDKSILCKFLDLGLYISLSGLITFNNSYLLQKIVKYIPLDRLLIETDSPYLTPVPYRNKKNDPSKIIFIIKKISLLKKINFNFILKICYNNFIKLFKI